MNDNIFIPKKIKVGFQKREDTYTKKLAYVIYYDEKNKLRKEQSWNSWREKNVTPIDYDNTPTSGFVLNKKVGGYKYDWNVRNTYVRVYDPRDFEFEITIPNLLFILENTNSIKGKGLEGDFIYGWSGSELLLVPTSSPDYIRLAKLNDLRYNRTYIKSKDLVLGATYLHKSNEKMIYMGKFEKYKDERWLSEKTGGALGKHYYFIVSNKLKTNDDDDDDDDDNNDDYSERASIKTFKSIGDCFIEVIDSNCVSNFAQLMDKIEKSPIYSPLDDSKTEYIKYTQTEFHKLAKSFFSFYMLEKTNYRYLYARVDGAKILCWCYDNSKKGNWDFDSITQLFNELKPCYKKTYLVNGKLYESTKGRG
jgi:hypothetical protein